MITYRGQYTVLYYEYCQLSDTSWILDIQAIYRMNKFESNLLEEPLFVEIHGNYYQEIKDSTNDKFDQIISMIIEGVTDNKTLSMVVKL